MSRPPFEPLEILAVLEKHRVAYVVIGKLAGIIHGTGGLTDGIDICPQMKQINLMRLQRAIDELDARDGSGARASADAEALTAQPTMSLFTPIGEIVIEPEPPGTRGGWDDVRRRASREPLGGGVRAPVAAIEDLVRIAAAIGGADENLETLRRVAELSRSHDLRR